MRNLAAGCWCSHTADLMRILAASLLGCASIAIADDFKTNDGKEYKNVTINRVEIDGIVVTTDLGVVKLYFSELPRDVQERFHYDPEQAAAHGAQQLDAYNREQAAAQAAQEAEKSSREKIQAQQHAEAMVQQTRDASIARLRARVESLQQQEDSLLAQIAQGDKAQRRAVHMRSRNPNFSDPLESQMPALKAHLDDVRGDLRSAKSELRKAEKSEGAESAAKPKRRK